MDLRKRILQRIDYLKKEEVQALEGLDKAPANVVGSVHRAAQWELIRALHERRRELEMMLSEDMKEGAWPVQPVIPGPLVQLPTNLEEMEKFHEGLIIRGMMMQNEMGWDAAKDYFKKLQAYFVNLTALQWNEGLIEKLESLERTLPDSPENTTGYGAVDLWLHQAHQNRATLADNCHILEQELNLKP